MREDKSGSGTEQSWVVSAKSNIGTIDTQRIRTETQEEALEKVSDWSIYEVRLRHENGGTEWEEVFGPSPERARREAFERKMEYVETLDVDESDIKFNPEAEREDCYVGSETTDETGVSDGE